ncbi:hypothetical protein SR39_13640 [Methylobacterium radiotolerans]|nr:hypothetical protein SR39_13640 [Methylobacterium radiotolerans]
MEQAINTAPAEEEVSGLPGISADEIERLARLAYEHPSWRHKQPWSRNPWARQHWTACITSVLAASAPTPPDRVGEEVGRLKDLLERFRDFVSERAKQWDTSKGPCNHHNPIWAEIAEALASAPSPGAGGDLGELDDVQAALKDCSEAVAFFDQVKRSTQAEQIAVGADHWNWLEAACRRAAAALRTLQAAGEVRHDQ